MNKLLIVGLVCFLSCTGTINYHEEEIKAIEGFANDFIRRNHLNKASIQYDPMFDEPNLYDSINFKVYISDALLPIAQIKQDNEWMFSGNYKGTGDSTVFYELVSSETFNDLGYREFDKSRINLIAPYIQFDKSNDKIESDEEYSVLNFSRVCFDDNFLNGIVVIEYLRGFKSGQMSGHHMVFLIKNTEEGWRYYPK